MHGQPKLIQIRQEYVQILMQSCISFRERFLDDFWFILGYILDTFGSLLGVNRGPIGSNKAHHSFFDSREVPGDDFWVILEAFWEYFGIIFGRFWGGN